MYLYIAIISNIHKRKCNINSYVVQHNRTIMKTYAMHSHILRDEARKNYHWGQHYNLSNSVVSFSTN
jgi:hypothetical protein